MVQLLAHITQNEMPSVWLTAIISFAAGVSVGVAVAFGLFGQKMK
jgi:hypothetical protein